MFVRRGIAEKDKHGIPETADDEPVVAADGFRYGVDRRAHVFEIDAVGSPRDADQLARHGSDLAALGIVMRCCPRRGDLRRHRDAFLHFRYDRPDEAIAAAGHGLDPTVAAGRLAEHPA